MSELNKATTNDVESKNDGAQAAFGGADGYSKLAKEAFDEMSKNKAGGPNSSTENSRGGQHYRDDQNGTGQREVKPGDRSDKSGCLSDGLLNEGKRRQFDLVRRPFEDGATKLLTGDTLVKDGDQEILFMPNGDKLKVNKDGSYSLNAKGGVAVKSDGGNTTITYPSGDSVTFSKNGIDSISRGNVTVDIIEKRMNNIWPEPPIRIPEPPPFKPYPQPLPNPYPEKRIDDQINPVKRPEQR